MLIIILLHNHMYIFTYTMNTDVLLRCSKRYIWAIVKNSIFCLQMLSL